LTKEPHRPERYRRAARSAQLAGINAFFLRARTAMRHAEHDNNGAAPVALKFSVTLFPASLQSVLLRWDATNPITISGATLRVGGRLLCSWDGPFSLIPAIRQPSVSWREA
jgi:hypothetical protein